MMIRLKKKLLYKHFPVLALTVGALLWTATVNADTIDVDSVIASSAVSKDAVLKDSVLPKVVNSENINEWKAEQNAVDRFSATVDTWQRKANSDGGTKKITSMEDIGHSYTALDLEPLSSKDYGMGELQLGDIYGPVQSEIQSTKVSEPFTTYTLKNSTVTVYSGPAESRLINRQLRGEGATYFYEPGTITNIHLSGGNEKTVRDIGIGNTRGELIFAYGSPNGMWRDAKSGNYIFLYAGHDEKIWTGKKESISTILNTDYDSQSKLAISRQWQYIAFTISNNKIESIDFIDGPVWRRFVAPAVDIHSYAPGELTDADFVLYGLRLNQHFTNDSNNDWRSQGTLKESKFIGYQDYGVSVDKNHLIDRVILSSYVPTRRGVAVGDTKYLMLFIYGMPMHVEENITAEGTTKVYEYKNPLVSNSYLLFTVDAKDQFIKSIMLSDRPTKQLK